MEHYKKFVVPKIELAPNPPGTRANLQNSVDNSHWSGYVDQGYTFKKVNGTWTIPTLVDNPNQSYGTDYSTAWVGIGGWNTNNLIQAGSEQDMSKSTHSPTYVPYYGVWWEVYPLNQEQVIQNLSISPGDQLYVHISYNSSDSGTFRWYMEDLTTGATTSGQKTDMSQYYDSSSAEWIMERPQVNGSLSDLADFKQISFQDDSAVTASGSSYYIGQINHTSIEMYNNSTGHELAHPGGLSSGGAFTDYWDNFN